MKYVSLDLETSGLDWDHCQIVEFGAVFEDTNIDTSLSMLPTYHKYILPYDGRRIVGEPYALALNHEIIKKISNYMDGIESEEDHKFISINDLADDFSKWIDANNGVERFNLAGKNLGTFDLNFLEKVPNWDKLRYSCRVIDPSILFVDFDKDSVLPNLSKCLERANLNDIVSHRSIDDAMDVIRLIRYHNRKK